MVEWVTDYLEGTLPPSAVEEIERHLDGCAGCRAYVRQIESTLRALGSVSDQTLSPHAWGELRDVFRRLAR